MMKAHPHLNPLPSRERREMDKARIKLSFSNAAKNYDSNALFQKEVADELLSKYFNPPSPPFIKGGEGGGFSILDIGCGTGFLSHNLTERFPEANILSCDISHAMVKQALSKLQGTSCKRQTNKIHFLNSDGELLPYKTESFDIVTSNLTYQWMNDIKTAFSEAYRVLRSGGVFVFSTLGTATLKELRMCYIEASAILSRNGLPAFIGFSDQPFIQSALANAGFKNISPATTNIIKTHDDMWGLLKNIKSIGAGNPFKDGDNSLARGSILKKMAEIYNDRFKIKDSRLTTCNSQLATRNRIYATYEVMFVYCKK